MGSLAEKPVTLANIRNAHPAKKRQFDSMFVWLRCVRQVSFYVTWLFLKLGISANQTTYLAILFGIVGSVLIATGRHTNIVVGSVLINLWFLLDQVDGNIARFRQNPTTYGAFVDGLGAHLMYAALFSAVGLAVFRQQDINPYAFGRCLRTRGLHIDRVVYLVCGHLTALALTLRTVVSYKYALFTSEVTGGKASHSGKVTGSEKERGMLTRIAYWLNNNILVLAGFILPFCFLASVVGWLDIYLVFYGAASLLSLVVITGSYILKLKRGVHAKIV